MRDLVYRLTNGTVVKTLREAQMSGQGYKMETVDQAPTEVTLTEKQRVARVKIS